jgi:transcriptional antiterminator NusG
VRIINGPFENFAGIVEEINHDRQKVKVRVSLFGRETPVELDYTQVTKL